jgi:hypothetical protein
MARKEVFATTGTRIRVRVFGGFDFSDEDLVRSDFAKNGYEKGVPMGGDLMQSDKAPSFLVRALRDPDGANLDRVQVIKGWLDLSGQLHERVYDVAVSDDREIGADGRCATPVGDTVDVERARFTNSIGEPMLFGYWEDTSFSPSERAFYYVRVLEIPTPTWLAYDKAFYGDRIELPDNAVMVHQERAYTSPIWYTP